MTFSLAFLFACGRGGPEDRLRITAIDSPVISAETPLELTGEGLPTGEQVQVELRGTLAAPGRDPRSVSVSLVGHVLAPERISVAVDARAWGRSTFQGDARVSCEAPRRCSGQLAGVSFDVDAADAQARPHHVVEQLLPALGLQISDAESVAQGLVLAEVQVDGPAARAGLREGDRLVRSNGVILHALADLAPGPGASALQLRVKRASGQAEDVRLSLTHAAPLADPRTFALCVLACPALLLLLGRLSLPAPGAALASLAPRWSALRNGMDHPFAFGALLCLLLSAASAFWHQLPDPFLLLAVQLGCVVALRAWSLDALGLWLAVGSAAALSGTRSWDVIWHDQLGGPWAWNALSRPPLALALALALLHASRLHAQPRSALAPVVLDRLSRALVAVLCAALFLGGAPASLWAKSLACYVLLAAIPAWSPTPAKRWLLWSGLLVASLAWPWITPGRSWELLLGSLACVFGVFWMLVAGWQARQPALNASPAASS